MYWNAVANAASCFYCLLILFAILYEKSVHISTTNVYQVKIHDFLEKTKRLERKPMAEESQDLNSETLILRNRVKALIKRNRASVARKLLKSEKFKPWGSAIHAKVC